MKTFFMMFSFLFLFIEEGVASSLIRDAEIERILRIISNPIFKAAGLDTENVEIYIVQDSSINAYVAGGMNIFIHTGLLDKSYKPDMVVGVIAHEAGHIAGGHLIKNTEEYKNASLKTILGYGLGLATAVAGSVEAAQAITLGTQHITNRQLLKYTRTHEEAADQAALNYLDTMGYSSEGLLTLLQTLNNNENALYDKLDPYTLTHPLSRERISHVQGHLRSSPHKNKGYSKEINDAYHFAIAKLRAFLWPTKTTLHEFPESDNSDFAKYARAIAWYKIPDLTKSVANIDELIKKYPENPYFYDTKGQILFENGKIDKAIEAYRKAIHYAPSAGLIKVELATAIIAKEKEQDLQEAIDLINQAANEGEGENAFAMHQLGIAYGRKGQLDLSYLALTKEAALLDRKDDVKMFAEMARKYIKPGTPAELKLKDITNKFDKKNK